MWRSFTRAQLSAAIATILDYGILATWVEVFHLHYPYGVALGSAVGAITNFWINRHWSFESREDVWHSQAIRYAFVSAGSLVLNTAGVFLLTEYGGIHYFVSQMMISIIIGFFYNFPLHRFYVYKKRSEYDRTIHLTAI